MNIIFVKRMTVKQPGCPDGGYRERALVFFLSRLNIIFVTLRCIK